PAPDLTPRLRLDDRSPTGGQPARPDLQPAAGGQQLRRAPTRSEYPRRAGGRELLTRWPGAPAIAEPGAPLSAPAWPVPARYAALYRPLPDDRGSSCAPTSGQCAAHAGRDARWRPILDAVQHPVVRRPRWARLASSDRPAPPSSSCAGRVWQ